MAAEVSEPATGLKVRPDGVDDEVWAALGAVRDPELDSPITELGADVQAKILSELTAYALDVSQGIRLTGGSEQRGRHACDELFVVRMLIDEPGELVGR